MSQRPRFTLYFSEIDKSKSDEFFTVRKAMSMNFATLREAKSYYDLLEPSDKRRIIDNVNGTCVLIDDDNKYLLQ